MSFAQGDISANYTEIKELISEEVLLKYYFDVNHIPCVVKSPLRVDKRPSLGFYYSNNGSLTYKDFSTGEWGYLDKLFKQLFKVSNVGEVAAIFLKDLDKIQEATKHFNPNVARAVNKGRKLKVSADTLEVKVREWKEHDLEFWANAGVTKEWLKFGNVYAISHIKIGNNIFLADKYAYVYVEFKDGKPTYKIYQPFSERLKWLNNHDSSVWDLWEQAMTSDSDKLFITSSRKDALCLWENIDIPSVALQGEGYLPKASVMETLHKKFPYIYCLYDNDFDKEENHGRLYGRKLVEYYPYVKQLEIPDFYQTKDPSDTFSCYGKETFKNIILNLF